MFISWVCLLTVVVRSALAVPTAKRAPPSVQLDHGTFIGTSDDDVDSFLGIPFAKPPTGNLRFNLPVPVDPYNGSYKATDYGPACPQQAFTVPYLDGILEDSAEFIVNTFYDIITPSDEDCLSLNVVVPAGVTPGANLPVVVWIFGGGFEFGTTSTYDGGVIVQRSIELNEPVVYVSMNYRLSAFGFLASQEVTNARVGNLGLQDQRLALRWIQKYISAFGGDPTKVTIWGESAGAISVALHLITNGGNNEGLFRGAFMQSGSPLPVGNYTHGQVYYDSIVNQTGCAGSPDTLQCLRELDYDDLKDAVDNTPAITTYQSLRLAWLPRADGVFLVDAPQKLVLQGSVAKVPFVTGDCDDEGTLFSLTNLNITTDSDLRTYMATNYYPGVSSSDLDALLTAYPADITQGSPFDTSILNTLTPEYKRLAAIQGDLVFQAPRRFFLANVVGKQPTWAFLNKRLKFLPILGTAHGTDLLNVYGGGELMDYLVNFVNHLDPNGQTGIAWPQYDLSLPRLLTFQDGPAPLIITSDDYREEGMKILTKLSLEIPI